MGAVYVLRSKEKMIEPVVMDDATPAPQVLWRPSLVLGAAATLVAGASSILGIDGLLIGSVVAVRRSVPDSSDEGSCCAGRRAWPWSRE